MAGNSPNQGLGGNGQHCAAWDVELTVSEVERLVLRHFSPLAVRRAGLKFYANKLGNSSPDVDIVGGRTLTVVGAASSALEPPVLWVPERSSLFFGTNF